MVERNTLVDEESLQYDGLFNVREIYLLIDDFLKLKGYDKFEPLNEESVYPDGKEIHIKLEPKKWHSDYIRKVLKIDIMLHNVKEVETEIDGLKVKLNQGNIMVLFSAFLETDYEGRFEQRPFYYFMRTIFDKFIYKSYTRSFEGETVSDLNELRQKMGSYLNLYRFRKAI
jgi:hypothetical protein